MFNFFDRIEWTEPCSRQAVQDGNFTIKKKVGGVKNVDPPLTLYMLGKFSCLLSVYFNVFLQNYHFQNSSCYNVINWFYGTEVK